MFLFLVVVWVFWPLWPQLTEHIVGDPETDAIRGMWSFDHVSRSLWWPDNPLRSFELAFPTGVWAAVLPLATAIFVVPIELLFGPELAWNLIVVLLIWGTGMGVAWLARVVSGSWAAGALAGAGVCTQPMLLHAVHDGTPEHVAFWGVPIFLGLTSLSLSRRSWRWAIPAGAAALVVALDSPYHAVYSGLLAVLLLPWSLGRPRRDQFSDLAMTIGVLAGSIAISAAMVLLLYRNFPQVAASSGPQPELWRMNATDIHTWWQYDWGPDAGRDPSLIPTYIPSLTLLGCVILGAIGGLRSVPWLATGLLTLVLSFGLNTRIPGELSRWLGDGGISLGNSLLGINAYFYALPGISSIRFPWRWLVPAALCFFVAASFGMARIGRRWPRAGAPLGAALAALVALHNVATLDLHADFPSHALPEVAFASWIAASRSANRRKPASRRFGASLACEAYAASTTKSQARAPVLNFDIR